jgi:hypothetical protein
MSAATPRVDPEQTHRLFGALAGARRPVPDPRVSADLLVREDGTRFAILVSQADTEIRVTVAGLGEGAEEIVLAPYGVRMLELRP